MELTTQIKSYDLTENKAAQLQEIFTPMMNMLVPMEEEFNALIVQIGNDGINEENTELAADLRKRISKVRIETEKKRKAEKSESLLLGKAIDGIASVVKLAVSSKEEKLKEIETHLARLESERMAEIGRQRFKLVEKYIINNPESGLHLHESEVTLSEMNEDTFEGYMFIKIKKWNEFQKDISAKREEDNRLKKERLEKERIEKEKREIEEKRIRDENAKLKLEAEEAEKVRLAKVKEDQEIEKQRLRIENVEKIRVENLRIEKEKADKEIKEKQIDYINELKEHQFQKDKEEAAARKKLEDEKAESEKKLKDEAEGKRVAIDEKKESDRLAKEATEKVERLEREKKESEEEYVKALQELQSRCIELDDDKIIITKIEGKAIYLKVIHIENDSTTPGVFIQEGE